MLHRLIHDFLLYFIFLTYVLKTASLMMNIYNCNLIYCIVNTNIQLFCHLEQLVEKYPYTVYVLFSVIVGGPRTVSMVRNSNNIFFHILYNYPILLLQAMKCFATNWIPILVQFAFSSKSFCDIRLVAYFNILKKRK